MISEGLLSTLKNYLSRLVQAKVQGVILPNDSIIINTQLSEDCFKGSYLTIKTGDEISLKFSIDNTSSEESRLEFKLRRGSLSLLPDEELRQLFNQVRSTSRIKQEEVFGAYDESLISELYEIKNSLRFNPEADELVVQHPELLQLKALYSTKKGIIRQSLLTNLLMLGKYLVDVISGNPLIKPVYESL